MLKMASPGDFVQQLRDLQSGFLRYITRPPETQAQAPGHRHVGGGKENAEAGSLGVAGDGSQLPAAFSARMPLPPASSSSSALPLTKEVGGYHFYVPPEERGGSASMPGLPSLDPSSASTSSKKPKSKVGGAGYRRRARNNQGSKTKPKSKKQRRKRRVKKAKVESDSESSSSSNSSSLTVSSSSSDDDDADDSSNGDSSYEVPRHYAKKMRHNNNTNQIGSCKSKTSSASQPPSYARDAAVAAMAAGVFPRPFGEPPRMLPPPPHFVDGRPVFPGPGPLPRPPHFGPGLVAGSGPLPVPFVVGARGQVAPGHFPRDPRLLPPMGPLLIGDRSPSKRSLDESSSTDEKKPKRSYRYERDPETGLSRTKAKVLKNKEKNLNEYYINFLDGEVEEKKGKWSPEEHCQFMKRVRSFGVNHKWGIFSTALPLRTGNQCRAYYKRLLGKAWIKDPNFATTKDEYGKITSVRATKQSRAQVNVLGTEHKRWFAFTVHKDPSGEWTDLPANHYNCPEEYRRKKAIKEEES